jgi:methylmalonic aciduria homocystinuria type C protein
VLIVDIDGPQSAPPDPVRTCLGCTAPCLAPFERALAASAPLSDSSIAEHAADWIAVRDACPVGRDFRYGEDQLAYHYRAERQRILPKAPHGS